MPMATEPYTAIGRVTKTHGLNGEVSVVFDDEASPVVGEGLIVWFVPPPGQMSSSRIVQTRQGPKGTLVSFEGVLTIDQAAPLLAAASLHVPRISPRDGSTRPTVTTPDSRWSTQNEGTWASSHETILTGANDVWVVDGTFGEVLIPVIDDVVLEIDEQGRTIRVALLPGLLEDDNREGRRPHHLPRDVRRADVGIDRRPGT